MRALLAALVLSVPLAAQPVVPETVPCSYDTCAIRVEPSFFGSPRIVRGEPGAEETLGGTGLFGGGLVSAVSDVPAAQDHALAAQRAQIGSAVASVVGLGAYVYAAAAAIDVGSNGDLDPAYSTAMVAGTVAVVVGGLLQLRAQREQSRAVWEYNRATVGF